MGIANVEWGMLQAHHISFFAKHGTAIDRLEALLFFSKIHLPQIVLILQPTADLRFLRRRSVTKSSKFAIIVGLSTTGRSAANSFYIHVFIEITIKWRLDYSRT